MGKIAMTVQDGPNTYSGTIARIVRTSLGFNDRGIFTASLEVADGAVHVDPTGGYVLDEPILGAKGADRRRRGTRVGHMVICEILRVAGVERWEDLKGRDLIVLYREDDSGWGSRALGIAALDGETVLVMEDFIKALLEDQK